MKIPSSRRISGPDSASERRYQRREGGDGSRQRRSTSITQQVNDTGTAAAATAADCGRGLITMRCGGLPAVTWQAEQTRPVKAVD